MKINKIKLYNFSSYEGLNTFDFTNTDPEKNIVLIGGKNGAGKTSLFTAIKIALYGPLAYGYVGLNSHYISKIKDLINSKAFQQDRVESEVKISVSLKVEREIKEYVITRKWDYTNQKLGEVYFVEKDERRLSEQELSYFQNYLQSRVPPNLFEFFLFDGEEVGNIFSTSSYNSYVKNAVFTLCGMDVFEIIRKYTNGYVSKTLNVDDENLYIEYEAVRNEVEKLTVRKENIEEDIKQTQSNLDDILVQITELETIFKNAGGITDKERRILEEKYKAAEIKKGEAAAKIKLFIEGMMPFIIVGNFTKHISNQLEFEEKGEIFTYVQNKLSKQDIDEILKNAGTQDEKVAEQIMEMLLDKFRPKQYSDFNDSIYDLSKDETAHVNGMISSVENFKVRDMIETVKGRLKAAEVTMQINRTLKSAMSDDEAVRFAEKENKLLKEKEEATSKLYRDQNQLEELIRELNSQKQIKEKIHQSIKDSAQNKHVYELSSGLSSMMSDLLKNKTVSMRKRLEKLIVQNLKHIYRKNNLITHVEVTSDFQFNLYQDECYNEADLLYLIKNLGNTEFLSQIGSEGELKLLKTYGVKNIARVRQCLEREQEGKRIDLYKKIELSRLSKGERQIFILSLYWAIIILSGQDIPFIIDTPYARIDANHRREISEKFFPRISKQVIILSTDEEINKEYYEIIKPYIAKEYLLINDENQNRTSVENCYFFEV
ncbi:MAG: AAA family ATPase [Eubacteriales bacterium]